MKIPQIAETGKHTRQGSDNVWPLRRADGRTWAESKHHEERKAA